MSKIVTVFRSRKFSLSLAAAVVLVIVGIGCIVYALLHQVSPPHGPSYAPPMPIGPAPTSKQASAPNGPTLPYSLPTKLTIPALKTNDRVIQLGKNKDGSVQVPAGKEIDLPGWYKYSPTPGQYGASVILGHVDDLKGPSLFWELENLQPGDKVSVARADGLTADFSVTKVAEYPKDNFPTNEVYSGNNDAELRLITCGAFDQSSGHYDGNTVVYAELTGSRRS